MSATYTNITALEMRDFLETRGFAEIPSDHLAVSGMETKEIVYGKRIDTMYKGQVFPISLRVYTSILPHTSAARGKGRDAIRTVAVTRFRGKYIVLGAETRTHRIETWRKNLAKKIESFEVDLGNPCPRCACPTVHRSGKSSRTGKTWAFYGCLAWSVTGCSGKHWIQA